MSLIATALKHMLAAGMPHDAIIAAVEEMESRAVSAPVQQDTSGRRRERNRRYYESRKVSEPDPEASENRLKASEQRLNKTVASETSEQALSLPSSPQTPQLPTHTRENNYARERGGRATKRVPPEWQPSAADLAVAAGEGLSPGEIERQLATMRDHEFRTARKDWGAAFRNWVRRASPASHAKPKGLFDDRPTSRSAGREDRLDRMLAGALAAVDGEP